MILRNPKEGLKIFMEWKIYLNTLYALIALIWALPSF